MMIQKQPSIESMEKKSSHGKHMSNALHAKHTATKLKHAANWQNFTGPPNTMKDNPEETVKVAGAFKQKYQLSNKATVHALISEMETFDKSNFKSEQYAQWQDMFDRVNDSMTIYHATFAPPTTVHDYLHSITTVPAFLDDSTQTDAVYSHPQALKTIHMSTPSTKEYLMADQEMLAPRLPIQHDQPAISNMVCTFPDCVAQGDSGANRALTNDSNLLTEFTPINPFQIGTISPKPIMATHCGITRLPTV